jgi:predicted DNA-binding protein YlxM (UPF0122 family)
MKQEFNDIILNEELKEWHFFDRQVFIFYHNHRLSMREIAKSSRISLSVIFRSLKKSQDKLNEKYNINYQEYRKQINNK